MAFSHVVWKLGVASGRVPPKESYSCVDNDSGENIGVSVNCDPEWDDAVFDIIGGSDQ